MVKSLDQVYILSYYNMKWGKNLCAYSRTTEQPCSLLSEYNHPTARAEMFGIHGPTWSAQKYVTESFCGPPGYHMEGPEDAELQIWFSIF